MSDLTPAVDGSFIIIAASVLPPPVTIAGKSQFMPTGQQVLPPMGYISFCMETRTECEGGTDEPLPFALTPQRRTELERVNAEVNALPEINDKDLYHREEYWTYASDRGGDCEDFALEKRRRLMALGWPKDVLLLATGKDLQNEGHAVLVAATASGDFVLDNREPHVRLWSDLLYRWLTRQSRERPYVWLSIDEPRFSFYPIAYFPTLGRPAAFLDHKVTAYLIKRPAVRSASSEATQAHRPPAHQK